MESIYNLVPEQVEVAVKPPMYRSMHDPKSEIAGSTFGIHGTTQALGAGRTTKKSAAHFGQPKGAYQPNSKDYLKSGTGTLVVQSRATQPTGFAYSSTKPSVPRASERPVMGLKSNKNFVTANAVEAILQVPQRLAEGEADYLAKADYGRVPEYLGQVKEEIRRENEMIDKYVADMGRSMGRGSEEDASAGLEVMSSEERMELLSALKKKWDAVNAKYQKICHIVKLDTTGKKQRKEGLEAELDLLEADIKKLAARGDVCVAPY